MADRVRPDLKGRMESSIIADWYADQTIFITGATGFMGKVMVEKLLRSCPRLSTIYILVRPKKGKEPKYRLDEFFKSPLFDKIKEMPDGQDRLKKLVCVSGDVTKPNCGLSNDDQATLSRSVTTIFHMAANVKFDQPLKSAILMNVGGTLNLLELACTFDKVKALVHVSTSYCHLHVKDLEEELYPAPQDPRKMLECALWMDDDTLNVLTPTLLKEYPNTYAYTKCLTEQLVSEYSHKLPLVIARPSIVIAAYKEPIPGWVDNINGPTGILIGAGKGVIRTMHLDINLSADIVPVDMVINALIIIAFKSVVAARTNEVQVFHVTANKDDAISWGEALEMGKKYVFDYPFSMCLWYPGGSPKSNYVLHLLAVFFFHLIPAYLVDLLMTLTGNKPFMVRVQKRIQNGLKVMQYYTIRSWNFKNEKLATAFDELSNEDRTIFYTNREAIKYEEYMLNYILGARKYCAKEGPETLPHARKVLKRLYYLDVLKNILLVIFALWMIYRFTESIMKMTGQSVMVIDT